jgi:small subunit ribosomal protein S16
VVKIRLARVGSKKNAIYRVVVADVRSPRDGRNIETIGHYRPRQDPPASDIDGEKALAWLRKGAQPTEQVQKLLTVSGVWAQFESEKGGRVDTKLARRRLDDPRAVAKRAKKTEATEAATPEAEAPAAAADQPAAAESAADETAGESAGEGTEESGDE